MTRVVELVISSAKEGIATQEIQSALSELYGKPVEHFDKLIDQVCNVKQPYTLLKDIPEETAAKHKVRLEKIGLECSIEVALALVPTGGEETGDDSAPAAPACPVCEEPTSSQEECSSCGVDLRKSTSARQSAQAIQRTLEDAQNELKNKKIQKIENIDKQRKEKKEQEAKTKQASKPQAEEKQPVKDVFTAEYVDPAEEKKRKMVLGGATAVVAAGVIAFGISTFTSSPPVDTLAEGEFSDTTDVVDAGAVDGGPSTDTDSESGTDASSADGTTTSAATSAGAEIGAAKAGPSAASTQSVIAAATAKVEAGTPNGGAADNFDETIAKFEHMATMQGDNRSAEEVAQDLIANAHENKAKFQQAASRTGGAKGTLQMPSSMSGIDQTGNSGAADAQALQMEGAGSLNLKKLLAKHSGKSNAPYDSANASGSYQDQFLDHWLNRQSKATRISRLVSKLMNQGQADKAQQLVTETGDTWLAIHGQHQIAIAEQMSGDAESSQDRMMSLFADLMMVGDLPEKIAALADHAQTWHLMLSSSQADNAFSQMKSMAAAPMSAKQTIVANVAMAKSLKITGRETDAREHFAKAMNASKQVTNKNGARDEMIHFIALAQASNRFGEEALSHAADIQNKDLRLAAFQRMYQVFSKKGMKQEAAAALQKAGGTDLSKVDLATLE